jgi:hypothetical protein
VKGRRSHGDFEVIVIAKGHTRASARLSFGFDNCHVTAHPGEHCGDDLAMRRTWFLLMVHQANMLEKLVPRRKGQATYLASEGWRSFNEVTIGIVSRVFVFTVERSMVRLGLGLPVVVFSQAHLVKIVIRNIRVARIEVGFKLFGW